jgi:predicted MFS family arabinose efflux permease
VIGPRLQDEFGLSSSGIGFLTASYFLAFAVAQIPLGMLLDRFGARRVEAALLLVAAVGAGVFAAGKSVLVLATGRALVGLGVSACLMAALKAFSERYPAERQGSLTGWMMAAGGLGAVVATAPLEAALRVTGWREVYLALCAITVAVAGWIFVAVPEPLHARPAGGLSGQWRGVAMVFRSGHFWRVAPLGLTVTGGFFAVQGLWSASWLVEVNGLDRAAAAQHLAAMSVAMLVTFSVIGFAATALARRGFGMRHLLAMGVALALVTLLAIVSEASSRTRLLWIAYGAFSSFGPLVFAEAARGFPVALSGRASTAVNVLVFGGAFALQWGMGSLIDALRGGGYGSASAHRVTFLALLVLQAAAYAWFLLGCSRNPERVHSR